MQNSKTLIYLHVFCPESLLERMDPAYRRAALEMNSSIFGVSLDHFQGIPCDSFSPLPLVLSFLVCGCFFCCPPLPQKG